jgi:hypothetical protein
MPPQETADTWLRNLNVFWTPGTGQFGGARVHRSAIETRLTDFVGIHRMFEIGSLRQGTGVSRFSDADYLVSMKGARPASQVSTLRRVKASLQQRFRTTSIVVRQPAVVCRFTDGPVEVVPGYPDGDAFWIPDPTGSWMRTYPTQHNRYVNEVNAKHGGGAKALARQLKVWKYQRGVPVSSCYLEMRAAKHLADRSTYRPLRDLTAALTALQTAQFRALNDPTGRGSRFTAYSSVTSRDEAISKLNTAVNRARKARRYMSVGDDAAAIGQLRLLFDHHL